MIQNNHNSFWETTSVYGFGTVFVRGISFVLVFFYTNLLTPLDAGVVYLIYTILAFLNPVYAYGMGSSLFKFYNNKKYDKKEVLASSFVSVVISSGCFSFIIYLLSAYLNLIITDGGINWFAYIAAILFFDAISARSLAILRVLEKPFSFLFINLLNVVSSVFCNFLFVYYYSLASHGVVFALLSVSVFQMFCVILFFIKKIHFNSFRFEVVKKMLLFGWSFLPAALLLVVIGFSDRWFIKLYLGLDGVGIYSPAYKVGSVVGLAVTAFNYNWQNYSLKKNRDVSNDFGKISSVFIIFLVIVFVLLSSGVDYLVKIKLFGSYLFGQSFWPGLSVVPFVALGYFFYGIYILHSPAIYLFNKQKWNLALWFLGAFINVLGNAILVPNYGLLGASYSTAFSYFIMAVFLIYKNKGWLKINFSFLNLFYCFLSACFVFFIKFNFSYLGLVFLSAVLVLFVFYNVYLILKIQKTNFV